MEEDGLVTWNMCGPRKYFLINPKIIQSPAKDTTYVKSDGSKFEIPLAKIEQFLDWQQENIKQFDARDLLFKTVHFPGSVDYLTFMIFLIKEAEFYELINKRWSLVFKKEIHILSPDFDPLSESLDGSVSWYRKISKKK